MRKKFIIILSALVIGFVFVMVFPLSQSVNSIIGPASKYAAMNRHYMMITNGEEPDFWNRVYDSAVEAGREAGVYVERFGSNLSVEYSRNELLDLAMRADVDGIIVEASEDVGTIKIIDAIVNKGIPVVTVLNDCNGSNRQFYVGVNSYDIGQLYGDQVCELLRKEEKKEAQILVTISADSMGTSDNLILLGIRERLEAEFPKRKYQVDVRTIAQDNSFATEEFFNSLFVERESLPDILICLDALGTICAYQAATDHYQVGAVDIIGYYDSEPILTELERNVLVSTLSVNAEQMGRYCIEVLEDYVTTGYANNYMAVDIELIDPEMAAKRLHPVEE